MVDGAIENNNSSSIDSGHILSFPPTTQQLSQQQIQPLREIMVNNQQNPMLQQQQIMALRSQGYQRNPNQMPNQSLQQILRALRTSTSNPRQQQRRLRAILRNNPQLLVQLIRNQRQRQQLQQLQQGGAMYSQQVQGQQQPGPQGPNLFQSNMQN